ncbi:hypothetical protein JL720_17261 [Aureococcus anophagefferens]|nr:hypothetical protein JL720_17261 [Aureococcus anophagefferens]
MIGSRRSAPMTERIDVFCRSMSGLSVKWGHGVPPVLERNVKTHGNAHGLRGGAGSSDLDDRQQPTLQTIAATNDVLVPPGTHRNSRLALQPYSGSYPDGIMRAYEAVSDAAARAGFGAGDGAVLARVATGQFDGVPVAVGASPADALGSADASPLDPAAAMETLMAGRQMVSGVDFSHLVLVGTNLSFPVAKHFTPPKGGGKAADLRHIGGPAAEALISAAPGLREFLRAERPLCLVDFVHSLRRIWGKSQDYFLPRATSSSTHLLMALRACGPPHEWVKHLSTKALRAKNRLCSQSVVSLGRLLLERLVATDAARRRRHRGPETYLVWKKDLRHNLVRSPCALACATKSTLVFVVTREGSVLAVTNKQPATVSLGRGSGVAATPATAVPKKASTKRSAPGALALVNPTGVAMFDNDRYLVVADFGQPAALIVVEYPRRTQSVVVAAFGARPRAVLVAELKFDLSPAAAIVVKHRVDLGGGEPCQLCVNAGGTMCFVTVWDATSAASSPSTEDAFSAKAYGAPFDQSWTIWGITEALVTLPDGGGAAAPAHETAPRVVVGALNGSRLVACDPLGVANVLLAGGDVAGDRDGALPHAQLDQPLGIVTSPHGRASVYVASAAGHCAGSVRLFNFGTAGLRKLMANLRAIGEACVLPDDYGYIRRNLGALPFDSVDAYRAHVHRRPFREAVAAMTAAIESIVADMDVMGAAIRGALLLLDDAFAELVCGGETGLTAAQLDASTSMLDVVTTHAERFNAQQRQAQHGAPERARLPGPHAKRVADFVAAALHVDDDDDDDEEEEEEGEGDAATTTTTTTTTTVARGDGARGARRPRRPDARAHLRRSCNTEARVTKPPRR